MASDTAYNVSISIAFDERGQPSVHTVSPSHISGYGVTTIVFRPVGTRMAKPPDASVPRYSEEATREFGRSPGFRIIEVVGRGGSGSKFDYYAIRVLLDSKEKV